MKNRSFLTDEKGSVTILSAVCAAVLFGLTAFAVDVGGFYYFKRHQQAANDFAALAAATNMSAAATTAGTSVQANGFLPADVALVEPGTYTADPTVSPAQRFSPAPTATPNAVRVTMSKVQPYLFGSLFTANAASAGPAQSGVSITTQSIATTRNLAAFSAGSGSSLDRGVANALLGSLLGATIQLSAADYQALASTNVELFGFAKALATRAALQAATYSDVASSAVSLSAAIGAVYDAVGASGQASGAVAALLSAVPSQSGSLNIATLITFGPYGMLSLGTAAPIGSKVSALALVSALAQLANGTHQVEVTVSVSLPGVQSAAVKVVVGEPPVGSSLIALGPNGTTLTTTQTRIRLDMQLVGPAPTNLLNLPVVLNIAPGTAGLTGVQCSSASSSTASVQLGVTPGLVDAWIGMAPDATLGTLSSPLNPPAATLANVLGLVTVSGSAHASVANTTPTALSFSATDIANGTGKTVSASDVLSSLIGSLLSGTQLKATILGLTPLTPSLVSTAVSQTLLIDATSIDAVLSSVLQVLGVSVGNATTWVSGVQCGRSVLVD